MSACGYSMPRDGPYGEVSPPVQPSVPGWSSSKRVFSRAWWAARPAAASREPSAPYAFGCSGYGDQ